MPRNHPGAYAVPQITHYLMSNALAGFLAETVNKVEIFLDECGEIARLFHRHILGDDHNDLLPCPHAELIMQRSMPLDFHKDHVAAIVPEKQLSFPGFWSKVVNIPIRLKFPVDIFPAHALPGNHRWTNDPSEGNVRVPPDSPLDANCDAKRPCRQ